MPPLPRATLALAASVLVASCATSTPTDPMDHAALHAVGGGASGAGNSVAAAGLAKVVHAATSRYHSTVQATRAGYGVASACVASPAGGMGFHWVNFGLVDPVFEPTRPEAVLYAPDANGNLKLVAVEYIVVDVGQPAPTFGGQGFVVGGAPLPVPHWTLHVWVHRDNPSGMFAPFNPTVTCPAP